MFRKTIANLKLLSAIFLIESALFFYLYTYECSNRIIIYRGGHCDNKRKPDTSGLLAWGYKPKETWHQHFQDIFTNLSITLSDKSYPDLPCNNVFKETLTENMDIVSKYPFNVPHRYLRELSLDAIGIDELSKPVANPRKHPVIVTGASSNHFKESQGMIRTYHQLLNMYDDLKLIYYDLGLTREERTKLELFCKCEVRRYEAEKYPSQAAGLLGYAWKPILIQQVLKEYDFVMWSDASVRYNGKCLDDLIWKTRLTGFQCNRGGGAILQRTSKIMFEFLKESPCLYNTPELEGGWLIISRNRFTLEYLMKPWISCGLSYNCMVYDNSQENLHCAEDGSLFHRCHRFDQSMLGILVTRLFHDHRKIVEFNCSKTLIVRQGYLSNYFKELK